MAMELNTKVLTNSEKVKLKDRLDEELALLNGQSVKRKIRSEDVRVYNWREPDKFSKSQLSTLSMLFDNFARESSTTLTSALQTTCEVEVTAVEQKPFQEVLKNMSEITALALIQMKPLEGNAIMELSLDTVQTMVYRVFGGEGGPSSKPKDLTMIERGVVKRITNELLKVLTTCFQNLDTFEITLDRMETNPQFIQQIAPAMEICVKICLNVQIDHSKNSNIINIILPFLMLESLLPKLTSSSVWLSKVPHRTDREIIKKKIEENLHLSSVDLRAEIGTTVLTLNDVEQIQEGDIIVLDKRIDEELSVFVENEQIGTASAGIFKGKAAVTINKIID